jgi:signal transduction histidine kinase
MKLFTRYSRINVLSTIVIFLVASTAFYVSLHYVLLQQIDDDLRIEEKEILTFVQLHDQLPESISVNDQLINYTQVSTPYTERHFTTILLADSKEKNKEDYRQLVFGVQAAGKNYRFSVSKSLEDTDSLLRSILLITFSTILVILIASFFINRVVLKRIWKPFYESLATVKEFKVSRNKKLSFPPVQIEEFQAMNQTLERITSKAQVEYLSLKTFSENAAHEIQTPLAIIRSKLDLLIQDEQLTENQSRMVQAVYGSIQKLVKLNQSLLLLAKIENNQYEEVQETDLAAQVEKKITEFAELWQNQQIDIRYSLEKAVVVMNPELADILLNNLLSNATRHNFEGGSININLTRKELQISNTSREPELDREQLFQRFYKSSGKNEHNGLGLSIIRQISDSSGFAISYSFREFIHSFSIKFP